MQGDEDEDDDDEELLKVPVILLLMKTKFPGARAGTQKHHWRTRPRRKKGRRFPKRLVGSDKSRFCCSSLHRPAIHIHTGSSHSQHDTGVTVARGHRSSYETLVTAVCRHKGSLHFQKASRARSSGSPAAPPLTADQRRGPLNKSNICASSKANRPPSARPRAHCTQAQAAACAAKLLQALNCPGSRKGQLAHNGARDLPERGQPRREEVHAPQERELAE
ncbi:hypothetical protein AOLI_G00210320 [Acnodon oligacanthus]